jgi:RNA polymerase sigma-70 factor (ECF subfamily)
MKSQSLDAVLAKLTSGDTAAAEQVFREYEPYLRKVVRRLLPERLRGKFDSLDIVQSAWGDLLLGFRNAGYRFASANQLRAFLVTAMRNRFIDRLRHEDRFLQKEVRVPDAVLEQLPATGQPSPSEQILAEDLWTRLLQLCPPEHRSILLLKRQGVSAADIAARTGLHPGTIRRILRNLASQMSLESKRLSENGTERLNSP